MVLKFGKRGVYSGNTLRTPSSKFLRGYSKKGYVVREDTNTNGDEIITEKFGIEDIERSNMIYSLNKKARWILPNILINAIIRGEFQFEEYGVQLYQKHNIRNKYEIYLSDDNTKDKVANCVSAYFSIGLFKKTKTYEQNKRNGRKKKGRGGYMCVHSLKNKTTKRLTHKRKRQKEKKYRIPLKEDSFVLAPVESEITFEVVYPSPITSSLTHNPKCIGYGKDKTRLKSKHQRLRRTNQEIINFDYLNLASDQEMSEDETEYLDVDYPSIGRAPVAVDFQSFVYQAIGAKKLKRKSVNRSLNDYVTVSNWNDKELELINVENEIVKVILEHTDTDPKTLDIIYGKRYVECECFPRKFIIDISDEVQALDMFTKQWKESFKQVHACVIFVFDIDNEINTTQDGVYKVYLNTSVTDDLHNTRIQTIFDFMETSVAECLTRSIFYIETLPDVVQAQDGVFCCSSFKSKRHFEKFYDWNTTSYMPSYDFYFESYMSACSANKPFHSEKNENLDFHSVGFDTPNGHICAICFEDIGLSVPGTSLAKCGHWFCDSCWREHLTSKVKYGSINIDCPEFACKSIVDKGTILSLLSLNDVIRFIKLYHDMDIDRNDETKWCPNSKCGRVLKVDSVSVDVIRCDCGQEICFKCLEKAHWPATCQSAKHYMSVLQKMGMGESDPRLLLVNGRTCPHCKRFFEKMSGCAYTYCICNNNFCWGCGKDFVNHSHGQQCNDIGEQEEHRGTRYRFVYSIPDENEWAETALQHRMYQSADKVRELKHHSKYVARELMSFMNQTSNKICLDFKSSNRSSNRGYRKESDKVPEFVENIVDLNFELRNIAEYVGVMLSCNLPESQRGYFINLNRRLTYTCETIEDCFPEYVFPINALEVLLKMKMVRASSLRLIKSIVHHVKLIKLL